MDAPPDVLDLHATTVALAGRAAVLFGPSGSGKSALGLTLMAFGAELVADDRTRLSRRGGALHAEAPEGLPPLIEARGVGLLAATRTKAEVALAVDLDTVETDRLPPWRRIDWLGCSVPLLHKVDSGHFAAVIRQYLLSGRRE